ncbi:Lipoyl synthase [Gemmata sp. SH-PL17]|uniref:lipoyl synthase n=1 Tax=Gemmata sp. SH-PL17 TaxID=1630693 RepID=UPI00078CC5C6|nr:lipoyl synthase [Gemmata sp. SH-PL17]AMV27212.1 Lipoyl synthase [Gemmata sp. SH-PL17]
MRSLTLLDKPDAHESGAHTPLGPRPARTGNRLPPWLKRPLPTGNGNNFTAHLIEDLRLETVCESAKCPNRPECWSRRTATFMIMGNLCTRTCSFCSVPKGTPEHLELDEPARLAEASVRLGLKHVVITSVTRDDLPDGGAMHFADCIAAVRARVPDAALEVLTPDFLGDPVAIDTVTDANPEVFNHNLETVPRLHRTVRGRALYHRSLGLLERVKRRAPHIVTKAGLMLGIGETIDELFDVLADLRAIKCDVLTLGQYLAPTVKHMPVARFVPPSEFDSLAATARLMGFKQVVAGPYVRSSYHAADMVPTREGILANTGHSA